MEWPKCKKCGCKHLSEKVCRFVDDKCDKCHRKGHVLRFHDGYTSLNKPANSSSGTSCSTSASDSSKTRSVTCVTQATVNRITDASYLQKIITDSGTTQHLIANRGLICDYYDDYSEYQTGSGEVPGKNTLHLPLANGSLMLLNVWFAPDLRYNHISTIQLGKKGVEMWFRTSNQPSQILHDGAILGYADPIGGQYVFRLQDSPNNVVNSAVQAKQAPVKPEQIKSWHARMGHLGYSSLTKLKILSTGIDFKDDPPNEICGPFKGGDQTRQPSKPPMSPSTELLGRAHSDLEGPFPPTRQGHKHYISFLEESTNQL